MKEEDEEERGLSGGRGVEEEAEDFMKEGRVRVEEGWGKELVEEEEGEEEDEGEEEEDGWEE